MLTATPVTKEKSVPVQQQKTETMRPRMKKKYNNVSHLYCFEI